MFKLSLVLPWALFALVSLPVVFLFTWLGKKYPPAMSDINMRRAAFGLLIVLGFLQF